MLSGFGVAVLCHFRYRYAAPRLGDGLSYQILREYYLIRWCMWSIDKYELPRNSGGSHVKIYDNIIHNATN